MESEEESRVEELQQSFSDSKREADSLIERITETESPTDVVPLDIRFSCSRHEVDETIVGSIGVEYYSILAVIRGSPIQRNLRAAE